MVRDQHDGRALTKQLLLLLMLEHVLAMVGVIPQFGNSFWLSGMQIMSRLKSPPPVRVGGQKYIRLYHEANRIWYVQFFRWLKQQNGSDYGEYLPRPWCDYSRRLSAGSTEIKLPIHRRTSFSFFVDGKGEYPMKAWPLRASCVLARVCFAQQSQEQAHKQSSNHLVKAHSFDT